MNVQEFFSTVDSLAPNYLRIWEDLVNIESPTTYKAGVDAVGKYAASYAESLGFESETLPFEKSKARPGPHMSDLELSCSVATHLHKQREQKWFGTDIV